MNIELIVIIAITVVAGVWVIRKYINGCKTKSCGCGCSCSEGKKSECGQDKKL